MRKKHEMKTLILYYSYGGNTKRIAETIQKEIGGDIVRMIRLFPTMAIMIQLSIRDSVRMPRAIARN